MALIKCPECEKEISDRAKSCPNCGCPINNENDDIIKENTNRILIAERVKETIMQKNVATTSLIISLIVLIGFIIAFAGTQTDYVISQGESARTQISAIMAGMGNSYRNYKTSEQKEIEKKRAVYMTFIVCSAVVAIISTVILVSLRDKEKLTE